MNKICVVCGRKVRYRRCENEISDGADLEELKESYVNVCGKCRREIYCMVKRKGEKWKWET